MFYILNRNGRIVASVNGPVDLEDLASRGETLVVSELSLPLDQLMVQGFPSKPIIVKKPSPIPLSKIELTTMAKDTDGDGLPELPADGRSKTSITATLYGAAGNLIQEPIEVRFRTSAGALSQRHVTTEHGRATVQLTASRETVMANVRASAEGFESSILDLEFIPVTKKE